MDLANKVETIIALNWMSMPQLVCVLLRDGKDCAKMKELSPLFDMLANFGVPIAFFPMNGVTVSRLSFSYSSYYHEDVDTLKRMYETCRSHHRVSPEKTIFIDFRCRETMSPGTHFLMQPWICNIDGIEDAFNKSTQIIE